MIRFPDIEGVLVAHLGGLLAQEVGTKVPNPRPESFVRLRLVGGSRRDLVTRSALVLFECWAGDTVTASDLGDEVLARVWEMPDIDVQGAVIRRVQEIGGLQSNPDPETESPRYQFTLQIDVKGVAT